jgi:SMC interacting uncharacterized protein involved in chromosome segregation
MPPGVPKQNAQAANDEVREELQMLQVEQDHYREIEKEFRDQVIEKQRQEREDAAQAREQLQQDLNRIEGEYGELRREFSNAVLDFQEW